MILFLDFDGVLHPIPLGGRTDLCYIPRLEQVLRDFPHVQVVISSMWRHDECHDLEGLRGYFSDDIKPRIIDVTPFVEDLPRTEWGLVFCQTRHREILQWVDDHDYTGPWVALDDAWREFPDPCLELIRCETETAFDEAAEVALRTRLAAYV